MNKNKILRIKAYFFTLFWIALIALQFGFAVLGVSFLAQIRGLICALVILVALMVVLPEVIKKYSTATLFVLFCSVNGLICGYINGGSFVGLVLDLTVIFQILYAFKLISMSEELVIKYLKLISVLSLIFTVLVILGNPELFRITTLTHRGSIWTGSYYCISLFWLSNILVIGEVITKKIGKIAYVMLFFNFFLSLAYLKRDIFVHLVLLLLIILVYKIYFEKKMLLSTIVSLLLTVFIILAGGIIVLQFFGYDILPLFIRIEERFTQVETTGFIRFTETFNYLSTTTFFDFILGKGYGVAHLGLGKDNTALHIGFFNLIFKNGIFLSLFYLYYIFIAFYRVISRKYKTDWELVCLFSSILTIIPAFTISNWWVTTPSLCIIVYALLYPTVKKVR